MSNAQDTSTLDACKAVDARVREDLDAELASVKRTIGIKLALTLFITAYMAIAINKIGIIDADFVVTTLRDHLRGGAQSFVGEASGELKKQAPLMVKELHKNLVDGVPALRSEIEHSLLASVDPVAVEIEKALSSDVGALIEDYKAKIESTNASLSDGEKLNRLVFHLRQDFRREVGKIAQARSSEFSADVKKINAQLKRLHAGKQLSKTEAIQRDILVTWNKLARLKIEKEEVLPAN